MEDKNEKNKVITKETGKKVKSESKKEWKKPTLEDVSSRVMAQPYIRFT